MTEEAETSPIVEATKDQTSLDGLYALLIVPCVVLLILGKYFHLKYGRICNK